MAISFITCGARVPHTTAATATERPRRTMKAVFLLLDRIAQTIAALPHVRAWPAGRCGRLGRRRFRVPAARPARTRAALGPALERSAPGPRAARRGIPPGCRVRARTGGSAGAAARPARDRPSRQSPDNLEQAARDARLAFFRETIASGAVERVATGHTRSDQAETVLFRFLRGSGTAGLAGIRPVTSEGIVRPLIEVERAEVEAVPARARHRLAGRFHQSRASSSRATASATNCCRNWRANGTRPSAKPWPTPPIGRWPKRPSGTPKSTAWLPSTSRRRDGAVLLARRRRWPRCPWRWPAAWCGAPWNWSRATFAASISGTLRRYWNWPRSTEGHGRLQAPGLDIFRSFEWLRFGQPGAGGLDTRNYRLPLAVPGTVRVPGTNLAISLELIDKSEPSVSPDWVYNRWDGLLGLATPVRFPGIAELEAGRPVPARGVRRPRRRSRPSFNRPVFRCGSAGIGRSSRTASSIVWARRFGPAAGLAAEQDAQVILEIREDAV